jgi:hypothetical protein
MEEQRPIPLGYEGGKKNKPNQLWFIVHYNVMFIDKKIISIINLYISKWKY